MSQTTSRRPARLLRAGLVDYLQAWALQRRLAEEVREGAPEALVLCSHPPTVTLGRTATPAQLVAPRAALEAAGVAVVETDRGGGATIHNPGQLVGYPILRLGPAPDLHRLLRDLEQALVRALGVVGVTARARPGLTGVWAGEAKIASIGLRFERGVTLHGFALNVENDLDLFESVVPCGLEGVRVTSAALQAGARAPLARVEAAVVRAMEERFRLCFQEVGAEPAPAAPKGAPTAPEGAPVALRAGGYGLQ